MSMEMNKALDLLHGLVSEVERKTCCHEETHRGGAIWEICDSCGAKWADDEGGKPEFAWPESVEKAREFLAAHPAVDQADVAAKLTFINGRPAMCGCQVEYSDGGGEYSDVIYVTLCAKHSGSAILDLVATNRIALTPEYEGQWHADLYLDREIPLAKVEGATPAEAVLALMSAERIDPEQESVEQAGGDERAAFEAYRDRRNALLESEGHKPGSKWHVTNAHYPTWEASRAALAQPSPAQAEAERPEVVARVVHSNPVVLGQCGPLNANDELMTVAQHAASVARWAEMFNRVEQERDAALARVAELEGKLTDWVHEGFRLNEALAVAKAQHSVPDDDIILQIFADNAEHSEQGDEHGYCIVREQHAQAIARKLLAAAPVCRLSRSALTEAQMRRLYENSTETENERLGFEAFARLIRRAEAVHQIAAAPGKEVGHE